MLRFYQPLCTTKSEPVKQSFAPCGKSNQKITMNTPPIQALNECTNHNLISLYLPQDCYDMISFSIALLCIGLLMVCFSAYRSYLFNKLTYSELLQKLRSHRRIYNAMSQYHRNSRYGKSLSKSIKLMDDRLKYMERLTVRSTKGGGNYVTHL